MFCVTVCNTTIPEDQPKVNFFVENYLNVFEQSNHHRKVFNLNSLDNKEGVFNWFFGGCPKGKEGGVKKQKWGKRKAEMRD